MHDTYLHQTHFLLGFAVELLCCDSCPKSFHADCLHVEPESLPDPWYCSSCVTTEAFDYDKNSTVVGNGDDNDHKKNTLVKDDRTSWVAATASAVDEISHNIEKISDSPTINSAAPVLECNDRGKSALIGKFPLFSFG